MKKNIILGGLIAFCCLGIYTYFLVDHATDWAYKKGLEMGVKRGVLLKSMQDSINIANAAETLDSIRITVDSILAKKTIVLEEPTRIDTIIRHKHGKF